MHNDMSDFSCLGICMMEREREIVCKKKREKGSDREREEKREGRR